MRIRPDRKYANFSCLKKKKIIVFGGKQKRPNVHIDDLIDAYIFFLNKNINSNIYNIGFENLSIIEIAKKISKIISSKITIKKKDYMILEAII